ncbi:MAG: hypothetical protein AAB558_04590 [Patescibacteria group bacterium]
MKLRKPNPEYTPRIKSRDVLEHSPAEEPALFDPETFLNSAFMQGLYKRLDNPKALLKEKGWGLAVLFLEWVEAFDDGLVRRLQALPEIKDHWEDTVLIHKKSLDELEDSSPSALAKASGRYNFYTALASALKIFPELITELHLEEYVTPDQLPQLFLDIEREHSRSKLSKAIDLIYLWPKEKERIITRLLSNERANPKKILQELEADDAPPRLMAMDLALYLLFFPEHKPVFEQFTAEHQADFKADINNSLVEGDLWSFAVFSEALAILAAEKAWINEQGQLKMEFPKRKLLSHHPLPERPTL